MSYPHFGYKRICRGGSWAVPDFLINKHYRNAQSVTVVINILVLELLRVFNN